MKWEDGASDGGSPILDYRITYSIGDGPDLVLRQGLTETTYLVTGIETGTLYTYKV